MAGLMEQAREGFNRVQEKTPAKMDPTAARILGAIVGSGYKNIVKPAINAADYLGGEINRGLFPKSEYDSAPVDPSKVTESMAEVGLLSTIGGGLMMPKGALGTFGGVMARGADLGALKEAEQLAAKGIPAPEIWKKTGWGKGQDGKWRFEIDDSQFSMDPTKPTMNPDFNFRTAGGEVFNHPELAKNYPELMKNMMVSFEPNLKSQGSYSNIPASEILNEPKTNFIRLNDPAKPAMNTEKAAMLMERYQKWTKPGYVEQYAKEYDIPLKEAKAELDDDINYLVGAMKALKQNPDGQIEFYGGTPSTSLHELQHGIQSEENFARGGSPGTFEKKLRNEISAAESRVSDINSQMKFAVKELDAMRERGASESDLQPISKYYQQLIAERENLIPTVTMDPGKEAFKKYQNLMGETESRTVQERMKMTPEERRANFPAFLGRNDMGLDGVNGGLMQSNPLYGQRLFHGTNTDFDKFNDSMTGQRLPALGTGHYMTPNPEKAGQYGDRIRPVKIAGEKMLDWNNLTADDKTAVVDRLKKFIPPEEMAGYGATKEQVFKPEQLEQARKFFEAKQEETKNLYHDRAKAMVDKNENGDFVIRWMEPGLENARPEDLLALAQRFDNDIAKNLGYDAARYGDEIVSFSGENVQPWFDGGKK